MTTPEALTPPIDVDTFLAGLDSPNHSPESRRAWVALAWRDMERAARQTPDTSGHAEVLERLRYAIADRRDWHEVNVRPDDIAALLSLVAAFAATPDTNGLRTEQLADAMSDAYTYEDSDNSVPTLPFYDDFRAFWTPFAEKVRAALAAEGLSIVKAAEWERAQRIEAAAAEAVETAGTHRWPVNCDALREALETP